MKTLPSRIDFTTLPVRGIGLIAAMATFSLAVFQLLHFRAAATNHDLLDVWRGLSIGSLYLLFFFSTGRRSDSGM